MVLDLSGKVENGSFAMLTGHEWSNEQEAALDLSGYGRPEQNEALDLTKSNTSNTDRQVNQSYFVANSMHQSHYSVLTPPTSRNSKPPVDQPYSLLQAALNSNQPTTELHPAFDRINMSTVMLDSRSLHFAGLQMTDRSRGIKPFSSVPSRSFGISVPRIAFANSTGAIIHGTPKPIAITTPQPHSSSVDKKGHTIADNNVIVTFGNQSVSSTSNDCYSVSQSNYNSKLQNQVGRKLNTGKSVNDNVMNPLCELKMHESLVERYMIRPADGLSHMMSRSTNLLPVEAATSFTCSQCPKYFKTKAALKLHTTVHKTSEERQYGCTVCQRRFLHQHHLVVHMRKHSGEKPFKCDACSKTFMAIFLLHKHLRKHFKEAGLIGKISFDQLKHLQDKKLIGVGSDSVHGIISSSSMKIMNEPVFLSDDEDLASSDPNEHVALRGGKLNSNVNRNGSEVRENSVATLNVFLQCDDLNCENTDRTKAYRTNEKIVSSELKVNSESKAITKCHINMEAETNISHSNKQEIKSSGQEYEITKQCVEKNTEIKEVINIIPENNLKRLENKFENGTLTYPLLDFKPGDEVELDFETGVLKVVNKIDVNVESEAFTYVNEKAKYVEMNIKTDKNHEPESRTEQFDNKTEKDERQKTNNKHTVQNFADDNIGVSKKLESAMCCENIECVQNDLKIRNSQVISQNTMQDANGHYKLVPNMKVVHGVQNTCEMKSDIDQVALDILSVMEAMKHKLCDDGESSTLAKNIKLDTDILEKESTSEERLILALPQAVKKVSLRGKNGKKCRKVKCEICCRTFHSDHYLLLHMAVHKRNPMLQSLKKAKDYRMKALGFVNKTNVTCEICKKIFKFQKSLNSHKRVHSEKLIEQKLFRKAFRDFMAAAAPHSNMALNKSQSVGNSESHLMHSVSVDHSINKGSIMECSKSVIETGNLENVKNDLDTKTAITTLIDKDNIKRYVCYACDKMYGTKQKLQMHALIHKDSCYLCNICGKPFLRQITLDKHISSHMLSRPYVRNVCKKSSKHRGSFTRHKVAHEKFLTSASKQKPDISSEIKMHNTHTKLKLESMQKKLLMEEREAKEFTNGKHDPLDLTVKSNVSVLPKLSSVVCVQNSPPLNSMNLQQPLITDEMVGNKYIDVGKKNDNKSKVVGQSEYMQGEILKEIPDNRSVYFINEKPFLSDESAFHNRTCRKSGVYQTTCRMCQAAFPNVMMLKSHMSVHSVVETHLYECHICRHRFTQSCSLLRHLKTSCQENKMKCVPCNKTFHKRSTFEQHLLLHQGVPPSSLDGSFYEKIREAADIRDALESDIENNNSCKAQILPPLTLDIIDLFETKEISKKFREEEANETDSDERTYLYSEGEVHSQFSDLSDNDWSSPSPRPSLSAQDLSVANNNISLNLLSAVCSDIRNAQKEAELNRKVLEDRQKELETIEILASLRQGVMCKLESPKINNSMGPLPCLTDIKQGLVPCPTSKSHSQIGLTENLLNCVTTSINDIFRIQSGSTTVVESNLSNIQSFAVRNDTKLLQTPSFKASQAKTFLELGHLDISIRHSGTNSEYIPSSNEACISSMPKTPISVLGVLSETHSRQKVEEEKIQQNRSINLHIKRDEFSERDDLVPKFAGPKSFQHLSLVKSCHPASHETHSLPMKAQVPKFSPHLSFSSCSSSPSAQTATITTSSVLSHDADAVEIQRQLVPVSQYKCDIPQDLSVKKLSHDQRPINDTSVQESKSYITVRSFQKQMSPTVTESAHIFHRSRTPTGMSRILQRSRSLGTESANFLENKQMPPRLVPMYQCDLCSRFIYSKTDLYIHMKEHGRSPGSLASLFPENISQMTGAEHHSPLDFSRQHSEMLSIQIPNRPDISPPQTLNISTEKSHTNQAKSTFLNPMLPRFEPQSLGSESILAYEMLSPMTDSSLSETLSSPTTPTSSSCNLDVLRQELRLKIYARRRSQGLDDLKIEFKTPEPAEMTEEEKLKLLYRRECNRQAAQRSRMRKKDLVDSLLEELHKEEIVNSNLRQKMESLVLEKNSLLKALHSHTCIQDRNPKFCEHDTDVKACTQEIDSISSDYNNELQSSDKELQSSHKELQSSDTNLQSSDKRAGEDQDCISKHKMMVSDFLVTNDR